MVDRVDAEVGPRWLQLCANSTGFEDPEGAPGGSSEPRQKKVTRNRTTAPSRRKVQGIRKKRKKLEKRTAVAAGTRFEVNVQRAVQALVPFLRQTGVVRGDIAPQGKMARALAVAFSAELDDVHPADEGGGIRTSETTRILYGADRESVAKVLERLVAAGGSVAILALAALAPLGNRRPRGAASSKAECCRTALSDIARGGMKLRAAQLQLRDERLGQRAPSSAAPPQPLRPQPLRDVAVAAAAAAVGATDVTPKPKQLPDDYMPGGARHCGGDLLFPALTLTHGEFQGRMPLFMMKSGAVALFSGSEHMHGTLGHHCREARAPGCEAHISFAVQTPSPILGAARGSERIVGLHRELLDLGEEDAKAADGNWADAAWLAVQHSPDGPTPQGKLWYDASVMLALPYQKVVLFDVETNKPLVLYDAAGGLGSEARTDARGCFGFLDGYRFTLNRGEGALGIDPVGEQRMLMLGVRNQGYNVGARPDASRKGLTVANQSGDLDGYVAHWDEPELQAQAGCDGVQATWEAIATRLNGLLPRASRRLSQELAAAKVKERLYCAQAGNLISRDALVNNVGVSAAYHSPAHVDRNDVAWTAAFAVKCC